MSLTILGKDMNIKNIIIVVLCLVAIITLFVAIVVTHQDKASALQAARDDQAAVADLKARTASAAAQAKEAQRSADMTKLVSICMDAQETYDALTAKQKLGKVRPDCTVSE